MSDNKFFEIFSKVVSESKRLKILISIVMVFFVSLFLVLYIFPLNIVNQLFQMINVNNALIDFLVVILVSVILNLIFSNDKLYYADPSKNKFARAFQEYWPSKHIKEKFDISQEEANYYWFTCVFNLWNNPEHPNYQLVQNTFTRGFQCRFIYYLQKILINFFWASILATLIPYILMRRFGLSQFGSDINIVIKIAIIILIIVLYALLRSNHKIRIDNLTGAWRKYREINQIHIQWIDNNIRNISDFEDYASN